MSNINYESVQSAIMNADSVTICISENEFGVNKGDEQYEGLMDFVEKILTDSHQMPALGIALNDEVVQEKDNKNWVEFNFSSTSTCNEMEFDSLLIFLEKDMGGLNVFRKVNGEYQGRCFYIDLSNNLNDFFKIVE